jgi:hypothetical protein
MHAEETNLIAAANDWLSRTQTAAIFLPLADGKALYMGSPADIASMLPDRCGAAVRGEAVAEFKLLPVKPTEAMYLAACHAFHAWRYSNSSITPNESNFTHNDVYAAMVSAAPHAPVSARDADAPSEPSEPARLDVEQSREYLVTFMEQHFTDTTFHRTCTALY